MKFPNALEFAKVRKEHEEGAAKKPVKEYLDLKFDPQLSKICLRIVTVVADKPVSIHAVHYCCQIQDVDWNGAKEVSANETLVVLLGERLNNHQRKRDDVRAEQHVV